MTVRRSALTAEVAGEPRSTRIGGLLAVVGGLLWSLHAAERFAWTQPGA